VTLFVYVITLQMKPRTENLPGIAGTGQYIGVTLQPFGFLAPQNTCSHMSGRKICPDVPFSEARNCRGRLSKILPARRVLSVLLFSVWDADWSVGFIEMMQYAASCYMEYHGDLVRHSISNYLYEAGTKFDDIGTKFDEFRYEIQSRSHQI